MNPFPTLTASCLLTFLSNLSKIDEVALIANLGKTSLAKGTQRLIDAFLPKLLIKKIHPTELFQSIKLY